MNRSGNHFRPELQRMKHKDERSHILMRAVLQLICPERMVIMRGDRCYGICDWHARGRTNVIGVCIDMMLINVMLFDGNINSDIFYRWITHQLLPALPKNAVVVLDNTTFHKRQIFKKRLVMLDIHWNICRHIHQILILLSISGLS